MLQQLLLFLASDRQTDIYFLSIRNWDIRMTGYIYYTFASAAPSMDFYKHKCKCIQLLMFLK